MAKTKRDVISAQEELSALGSKKVSKKRQVFNLIGEVLMLLLFTLVISVSGQITYDYSRYSTFFVNGMSMYPTLNKNVYAIENSSGAVHNGDANDTMGKVYTWQNFTHSNVTYYCDYGMFDAKGFSLAKLKRFDILVTYFKDDMVKGSDGKYVVKTKALNGVTPDLKIKRVIAFPGETFYFDGNGDLWVKGKDETTFTTIAQPFLDNALKINANWKKQTLTINSSDVWASGAWHTTQGATLADNEYFVLGDNRLVGASWDSRYNVHGPVPGEAIQGKAVTIIGRCAFRYYNDNENEYHPVWNAYLMPWQLEWL
jgi:signal peptidase I